MLRKARSRLTGPRTPEYVVVVLLSGGRGIILSHSEKGLLVGVDLLGSAVFVEGSSGEDSNHAEGDAGVGDAVALLGRLDVGGSEDKARASLGLGVGVGDVRGLAGILDRVTNLIHEGKGVVSEEPLHFAFHLFLKIMDFLVVDLLEIFKLFHLLLGALFNRISPLLNVVGDRELDLHA